MQSKHKQPYKNFSSISCATDTLRSAPKKHCGSISSPVSRCFPPFTYYPSLTLWGFVSNFLFEWGDAQGSVTAIDPPSQPICCQKHLACSLSVSLAKKNMSSLSFHLDALVKWKGRWRERASQTEGGREGERADWHWKPLSGRQHKLVWGKFNNRGQEAEAVSPLCLFDLPLTWVYLKPGRDSSTVWCVLQHWPAKAACCASWHNLIEKSEV